MNIISYNLTNQYQKSVSIQNPNKNNSGMMYRYNNSADVFTPSFGANTSNGTFLKRLKNVRGAYSDAIPLKGKEYEQIKRDISYSTSAEEKLDVLKPYMKSMLPVEKNIYKLLCAETNKDNTQTLPEILRLYFPAALNQLNKEQNIVFDNIEEKAKEMPIDKNQKIDEILESARQSIILPFDDMNKFKRKPFIDSIIRLSREDDIKALSEKISSLPEKQQKKSKEKFDDTMEIFQTRNTDTNFSGKNPLQMLDDLLKEHDIQSNVDPHFEGLIDEAKKLPTSINSENAFIVKYAGRSENEIAERIVSESLGTIEHIKLHSLGGENEAYNFVLATKSRNGERGNEPPAEYLKKHPELPKTFQHSLDDVIREANKGHLKGEEWYPYTVKERAKEEYGFELDISEYRIPPDKAFRTFPKRLRDKFPQFKEFFTDEPLYNNKKKK